MAPIEEACLLPLEGQSSAFGISDMSSISKFIQSIYWTPSVYLEGPDRRNQSEKGWVARDLKKFVVGHITPSLRSQITTL